MNKHCQVQGNAKTRRKQKRRMEITLWKSLAVKKSREREALPKKRQGWGGWFLEVGGIRHASIADDGRSWWGKGSGMKIQGRADN